VLCCKYLSLIALLKRRLGPSQNKRQTREQLTNLALNITIPGTDLDLQPFETRCFGLYTRFPPRGSLLHVRVSLLSLLLVYSYFQSLLFIILFS